MVYILPLKNGQRTLATPEIDCQEYSRLSRPLTRTLPIPAPASRPQPHSFQSPT